MIDKSARGFTVAELIIVAGIGTLVASLASLIFLQVNSSRTQANLRANLTDLKNQYTALILDDWAWQATINDTARNGLTTFDCLRNRTLPCVPAGAIPGPLPPGYRFTPVNTDGSLLAQYDPRNTPNQGFTPDGTPCNAWVDGVPNPACPIRIDFTWQPICPAGPGCINPPVEIRITFRVQAADNSVFGSLNMDMYNTTLIRGGRLIRALVTGCGPTDVTVGFDLSGQPICVNGTSVR